MATFKQSGRVYLWVDEHTGQPTEPSALQALHHLGYRARSDGWSLGGRKVLTRQVCALLGVTEEVALQWASAACGQGARTDVDWSVLGESAASSSRGEGRTDATLHLRIPQSMYEGLQRIVDGRQKGSLLANPKRLHALARELLLKQPSYFDAAPYELIGRGPSRLIHVRIPRHLLTEMKERAAGVGERGGPLLIVRDRGGWHNSLGGKNQKAVRVMSLSAYARARLWNAMRAELSVATRWSPRSRDS